MRKPIFSIIFITIFLIVSITQLLVSSLAFLRFFSIKALFRSSIKHNIKIICGGITVAIVLFAPLPYFSDEGAVFMSKSLFSAAHAEASFPLTVAPAEASRPPEDSIDNEIATASFYRTHDRKTVNTSINPFFPLRSEISDAAFLEGALTASSNNPLALSSISSISENGLEKVLAEDKIVDIFPLNYIPADYISQELASIFPSANIRCDIYSNSLIFYGAQNDYKKAEKILRKIDKPKRQISLEAKIIALHKGNNKDLGINWDWDEIPSYDKENKEYPGHIRFGRHTDARFNFKAGLKALVSTGKAKILATPGLMTIPGKKASIFIGSHIPVVTEKYTNKGEATYSTEYVDAGITLSFLPILSKKGMITAEVNTEVSTPSLVPELKNYRINSRSADTTVRMKDGETIFIGGLISEEEEKRLQKIPLLCKIPLFGHLFTHRYTHKENTEIIILLTPHIK